jgi:hypothetical protein
LAQVCPPVGVYTKSQASAMAGTASSVAVKASRPAAGWMTVRARGPATSKQAASRHRPAAAAVRHALVSTRRHLHRHLALPGSQWPLGRDLAAPPQPDSRDRTRHLPAQIHSDRRRLNRPPTKLTRTLGRHHDGLRETERPDLHAPADECRPPHDRAGGEVCDLALGCWRRSVRCRVLGRPGELAAGTRRPVLNRVPAGSNALAQSRCPDWPGSPGMALPAQEPLSERWPAGTLHCPRCAPCC